MELIPASKVQAHTPKLMNTRFLRSSTCNYQAITLTKVLTTQKASTYTCKHKADAVTRATTQEKTANDRKQHLNHKNLIKSRMYS